MNEFDKIYKEFVEDDVPEDEAILISGDEQGEAVEIKENDSPPEQILEFYEPPSPRKPSARIQ